jgi:hypothetical protein
MALVPDLHAVDGHIGILTLDPIYGLVVGQDFKDALFEQV